MTDLNYKINPVKATCLKYQGKDHGIQGMNDTCFGICAAFSNTYDTYAMDPQCSKSCEDLIEKRKHELFGVGSCDHQVPYRPVAWEQVPRYVPRLLKSGKTPEESYQACLSLCEKNNLVEECKEKCLLDYNAIETYKDDTSSPIKIEKISFPVKTNDTTPLIRGVLVLGFIITLATVILTMLKFKK